MMDPATWGVLHDGVITRALGVVPGDLTLSIEIRYLCGHLPTTAEHLVVMISSCEQFEYRPFEQPPVTEPHAIAALELVLLYANLEESSIRVDCSDGGYGGILLLRYESAQLFTAEGRPLSQSEVESASEQYWALWKQRQT